MANKKYRGILKEDLVNAFGSKLFKGQEVIVHKRSVYDEHMCRTGKWEYHYTNLERTILIRDSDYLITLIEKTKPPKP